MFKDKQETDLPKRVVVRPPDEPPKEVKGDFNDRMYEFFERRVQTLQQLPDSEHERFVERFSITITVALACVLSSYCYWYLPPLVRVLVVPVFIGAAWWVGANVVAKFFKLQEVDGFDQCLQALELRYLFEAVKFSGMTFAIAAIPFLVMPAQYEAALDSADARTLFLGMFIWNLIGAPLFAQTRDRRAKLIISLVFAVPVVVATIWWVNTNPFFDLKG